LLRSERLRDGGFGRFVVGHKPVEGQQLADAGVERLALLSPPVWGFAERPGGRCEVAKHGAKEAAVVVEGDEHALKPGRELGGERCEAREQARLLGRERNEEVERASVAGVEEFFERLDPVVVGVEVLSEALEQRTPARVGLSSSSPRTNLLNDSPLFRGSDARWEAMCVRRAVCVIVMVSPGRRRRG
jgi:hypothetical protein